MWPFISVTPNAGVPADGPRAARASRRRTPALGVTEMKGHIVTRVLLALGVVATSLICLPYVLRAWPGLPWEWVRFVYLFVVIVFVVVADRIYARSIRDSGQKA